MNNFEKPIKTPMIYSVNLVINSHCNLRCPYCFAQEITTQTKNSLQNKGLLTLNGLEKILHLTGDQKQVKILGGEPTLHPHFVEICERVGKNGNPIFILTNATLPLDSIRHLNPGLLVNFNDPSMYSIQQLSIIRNNFQNFGAKVVLSLNIFDDNFSWNSHLQAINEFGLSKSIRIGISQPIHNQMNHYLETKKISTVTKKILLMAESLARHSISIYFDCGFTPCMFENSEIAQLLKLGAITETFCEPALDIGPKLEIWRCFPFSSKIKYNLDDFSSLEDAWLKFKENDLMLREQHQDDNCRLCEYYRFGICDGGCLSRLLLGQGEYHASI